MKPHPLTKQVNSGVKFETPVEKAFIAGLESGIIYKETLKSGDWKIWLPSDEVQSGIFDTMACVTFSGNNVLEMQMNFLIESGAVSDENIAWLRENGYFDESGLINFSDRFGAYTNGTTEQGNYMTAFWDGVRKYGLVPEKKWAYSKDMDRATFFAKPPQALYDLGLEFLKRFQIKYEWVYSFVQNDPRPNQLEVINYHLKQAPLHVATITTMDWLNDVSEYKSNACGYNHATSIYGTTDKGQYADFDHYVPFRKVLSKDYCINQIIKGVIEQKVLEVPLSPKDFTHKFTVPMNYKETSTEVKFLQQALKILGYFKAEPTGYYGDVTRSAVRDYQTARKVASTAEIKEVDGKRFGQKSIDDINSLLGSQKKSDWVQLGKLNVWVEAIRQFEGWYPPNTNKNYPKGSRSWRNKNAGNIKTSSYSKKFKGVVGEDSVGVKDGSFCVFDTIANGDLALKTLLTDACKNKLTSYKGDMSLLQFYEKYAPSTDGNYPKQYATAVATRLGTTIDIPIKYIL